MLFTKSYICHFDWNIVARAFYRLYPSEYYPHVGDVHIIDHEVLPDSRQVKVRRIARIRYKLPSIVRKLFEPGYVQFDYIVGPEIEYMLLEESLLDINKQSISLRTTGFTMMETYSYDEEATFTNAGNGITQYRSAITFCILGFGLFNSTLESVTRHVVSDFMKRGPMKKALVHAAVNLD